MKKILLILAIILFYSTQVKATELVKGKILTNNDTIDATFKISVDVFSNEPNYMKLQEMVKYYNTAGKVCVLSPGAAKEIRFTYRGVEIRMLSTIKSNFLRSSFSPGLYVFLKLVVDGDVKLFNYYYMQPSSSGGSYSMSAYILKNDAGDLVAVNAMSFKEDMSVYFGQCPALAEKIEDKTYRIGDIEAIVQYYNSSCK